MRQIFLLVAMAIAVTLAGCSAGSPSPGGGTIGVMQVTSSAFTDGGSIPAKYTCDGEEVSPPIAWNGVPPETKAIALTVVDPDARDFVHWLAADIPAGSGGAGSIAEGATGSAAGAEGRNSGGRPGFYGPCPPSGEHRYVFTVYALSALLGLGSGFSHDELSRAMDGKVLASGTLTARYRRR